MNHPGSSIQLSHPDVALLIEALDSHESWQLSKSHERSDGYSTIEDGVNEEVDSVQALIAKLESYAQEFSTSSQPLS